MATVFISYSHKDKIWLDKLRPHLHPLESDGEVQIWDDTRIKPGDEWLAEIERALSITKVAILLVSANFLASGFIMRKEVPGILARASKRGCLILCLIVRPCRFSEVQTLQRFQAVNSPRHPLAKMKPANAEEFFVKTAETLFAHLKKRIVPFRKKRIRRAARENPMMLFVDKLLRQVELGDWDSADRVAIDVIATTDAKRQNRAFTQILGYLDCRDDDDRLWGAIQTIERCVAIAPWLISDEQLGRMARHQKFSVRSCAASICLDLALIAPHRVPVDVLMRLSAYDEDWYVEVPANAALKSLVGLSPGVLQVFYGRLRSDIPEERSHAAAAILDISDKQPGLLDTLKLHHHLVDLRKRGDAETVRSLMLASAKARRAKRIRHGLYGF